MIEKSIFIDGKKRTVKSSALIPKLYRAYFGRDMVADMRKLSAAYKKTRELAENASDDERAAALMDVDFTVLENIAWIMLKHGGEDVGETPEDWMESLNNVFSIYMALPELLDLWNINNQTTSIPRKK